MRKNMFEILDEANLGEDKNLVGLHAGMLVNTGYGLPSQCATRAVAEYRRLGRHEFVLMHYRGHADALRKCGCPACLSDLARKTADESEEVGPMV